jgi:hypothetical protein
VITDHKVRENRLRRMAERQGYRLEKSRRRDPMAIDYGGYMLVDAYKNTVVYGYAGHAYTLTIEDIEQILSGKEKVERKRPPTSTRRKS